MTYCILPVTFHSHSVSSLKEVGPWNLSLPCCFRWEPFMCIVGLSTSMTTKVSLNHRFNIAGKCCSWGPQSLGQMQWKYWQDNKRWMPVDCWNTLNPLQTGWKRIISNQENTLVGNQLRNVCIFFSYSEVVRENLNGFSFSVNQADIHSWYKGDSLGNHPRAVTEHLFGTLVKSLWELKHILHWASKCWIPFLEFLVVLVKPVPYSVLQQSIWLLCPWSAFLSGLRIWNLHREESLVIGQDGNHYVCSRWTLRGVRCVFSLHVTYLQFGP